MVQGCCRLLSGKGICSLVVLPSGRKLDQIKMDQHKLVFHYQTDLESNSMVQGSLRFFALVILCLEIIHGKRNQK